MAEYITYYVTQGEYDSEVFSPAAGSTSGDSRFSNGNAGETFEAGETLTGTLDGDRTAAEYVGFYDDGILVLVDDTYYFLSVSPLANEDAFAVNANAPFVTCFLAGTRIATVDGNVEVQDLVRGTVVLTADGRRVPVKWIGRQTVVSIFGPDEQHWPVAVAAGALGPDLPQRTLQVTADHALALDGVLVQAGALVNGTTIRRLSAAELGTRYTVLHVELEDHSLVLAEGVAAETFVDNVTRRRFDNYAEYEALFGDDGAVIAEMALPRVKSARQLPRAIRDRLEERASALGGPLVAAA